jgi:hypothetical protein
LYKRQAVVGQMSHHDVFQPLDIARHAGVSGWNCVPITKLAQILAIGTGQ